MLKKKVFLLILSLSVSACDKTTAPAKNDEVRQVRVQTVSSQGISESTTYSGEIRARYETPLSFRVSGQVATKDAEIGQVVMPGQILLKLDQKDPRLQEASDRSQFEKASLDYNRVRSLHEKGFVSQSNVDQARASFDVARAKFQLSKNQARYAALVAERAGIITAVNVEAGQFVGAGVPVLEVAEGPEREVVISVPESEISDLRSSGKLTVSLWALPGRFYEARLRELAEDADPITRTYSARIAIIHPDKDVRLGMTASVSATKKAMKGVLLPLTAIFEADNYSQVWLVDKSSMRVKGQPVVVSGVRNDYALVTSGIKAEDVVVTAGVHLLHANEKVGIAPTLSSSEVGK